MTKRFHWLERQIKKYGWKKGCELGVKGGVTTVYLLKSCPNLHMIAVDPWEEVHDDQPMPEGLGGGIKRYSSTDPDGKGWDQVHHDANEINFRTRVKPFKNRIHIHKGYSFDQALLDSVPNGSLDFVFIDALHNYEGCSQDIRLWRPKVRQGGMICGHDINWPGVRQAVQELIPDYKIAPVDNVWFSEVGE